MRSNDTAGPNPSHSILRKLCCKAGKEEQEEEEGRSRGGGRGGGGREDDNENEKKISPAAELCNSLSCCKYPSNDTEAVTLDPEKR